MDNKAKELKSLIYKKLSEGIDEKIIAKEVSSKTGIEYSNVLNAVSIYKYIL